MCENKPIIHPSSRELEVLETLWKADRSLTGTEIVESSPNKTKNYNENITAGTRLQKQIATNWTYENCKLSQP